MFVFLTSGDKREFDLRAAIEGKGYVIDHERSAFVDPEVVDWRIKDPPCLVKVHNGRAVYELSDPADVRAWSTIRKAISAAVAAADAEAAG